MHKCWATNVMAHVQLLQAAEPIMRQNADGGVYILTSSIAVSLTHSQYSMTRPCSEADKLSGKLHRRKLDGVQCHQGCWAAPDEVSSRDPRSKIASKFRLARTAVDGMGAEVQQRAHRGNK